MTTGNHIADYPDMREHFDEMPAPRFTGKEKRLKELARQSVLVFRCRAALNRSCVATETNVAIIMRWLKQAQRRKRELTKYIYG